MNMATSQEKKTIMKSLLSLIVALIVFHTFKLYDIDYQKRMKSENNSRLAKKRRKKRRVLWTYVNDRISDLQFRRMFRMTRDCFDLLCNTIIAGVGEKAFKSEAYIDAFLKGKNYMYDANVATTGGYIAGEVKLAITLRLLAGGDALDIGVIFDVYPGHIGTIVYHVLSDWVKGLNIGKIDISKYLNDVNAMSIVSEGFAERSNGVLKGAIGAIDGWLVRIRAPSWFSDRVSSPITFFSRKGFFALNVQCIVDDKKRVLWASYSHKGASHDSSCLRETKLYSKLIEMKLKLYDLGFFLLGDSAYGIESFLIPPYDNTSPKTPQDDFNFYHSSARITVECAFGEIDLRWGIFWKRLSVSLENAAILIEGAMHLHNFLVDYRESKVVDKKLHTFIEREIFQNNLVDSGIIPLVVGEEGRDMGRPLNSEREWKLKGILKRDLLKTSLMDHGLTRPRKADWLVDKHCHIIRTVNE